MKIRDMSLSARAKSCLLRVGYEDSAEIEELSDEDLLAIKNLNRNCVDEIRTELSRQGSENYIDCFENIDFPSLDDAAELLELEDYVSATDYGDNINLFVTQLFEVFNGTLSEREQRVLRLKFGIDDGQSRTLEEVSDYFEVSKERIRRIEEKALRKLCQSDRIRKLRLYVDPELSLSDILERIGDGTLRVDNPDIIKLAQLPIESFEMQMMDRAPLLMDDADIFSVAEDFGEDVDFEPEYVIGVDDDFGSDDCDDD